MKGSAFAASLALLLSAAPLYAQAAGQARPAAPSPAPPAAAQPAPAPVPPPPFPAGAKIAFVNLQQVANLSGEGKISTGKVQALMQKKQTEAQAKSKALADAQAKLQTSGGNPVNYIQLDLRSILGQGFSNFQISVGSIQPGESFLLFGSNTQGELGTQLGGAFGSTFDDQFVSVTNTYQFISIAAGALDVLPVAFRATVTPVPEMSALFPVFGLIAAVSFTQILRRRRAAQKTASIG